MWPGFTSIHFPQEAHFTYINSALSEESADMDEWLLIKTVLLPEG